MNNTPVPQSFVEFGQLCFGNPERLPEIPKLSQSLAEGFIKVGRCQTLVEANKLITLIADVQQTTREIYDELNQRSGGSLDIDELRSQAAQYVLETIDAKYGTQEARSVPDCQVLDIMDGTIMDGAKELADTEIVVATPTQAGATPWLDEAIVTGRVAELSLVMAAREVAADTEADPATVAILADRAAFQEIKLHQVATDEAYTAAHFVADQVKRMGAAVSSWIKTNANKVYTGVAAVVTLAVGSLFGPKAAKTVHTLAEMARHFVKEKVSSAIAYGVEKVAHCVAEKAKKHLPTFIAAAQTVGRKIKSAATTVWNKICSLF